MPDPRLISVRTQVVLETLVGSMAEAVERRLDEPLDPAVEAALAATKRDPRLARMGYLARAVEVERFDRARQAMPWLAELFLGRRIDGTAWSDAAAPVATELAGAEPSGRPEPGDERAVSWKVPGPGGHVRHYLAVRCAEEAGARADDAAKHSWMAGFLVHCLRESAPPRDEPGAGRG